MKVSGSGLTRGEWIAVLAGVVLAVSLLAVPWFAITVDGFVQPGLDGAAFELLAGLDVVLLLAALIPLVVPALRAGPLGVRLGDGGGRVVAVAGLVAVLVTLYVTVAPPEPDVLISGALESSADVGLAPRAGAFIGLAASLAILGGGAIDMATAAAARQAARPRPQAVEAAQLPVEPAVASAAPLAASGTKTTKPTRATATKRAKKPVTAKKSAKPAAGKTTKKAAPKKSARKPGAAKRRKAPAKVSFAAATEAQLRGLGLSTTQARRVLRYRDELGLVSGVGELDVIPGLSKATVAELKSKLRA